MHDTLIDIYREGAAEERCGFILEDGTVIEVDNVHSEPEKGFRMNPEQVLEHLAKPIVASWHTHPGGDPNLSQEDYAGFLNWPELQHHIVGTLHGEPAIETFAVVDGLVVKA